MVVHGSIHEERCGSGTSDCASHPGLSLRDLRQRRRRLSQSQRNGIRGRNLRDRDECADYGGCARGSASRCRPARHSQRFNWRRQRRLRPRRGMLRGCRGGRRHGSHARAFRSTSLCRMEPVLPAHSEIRSGAKSRVQTYQSLDRTLVLRWSTGWPFAFCRENSLSPQRCTCLARPSRLGVRAAESAAAGRHLHRRGREYRSDLSLVASRWVGPTGQIYSFEPSRREYDNFA